MTLPHAVITSVGGFLPQQVVSNHDFAQLDTSDQWIRERTGITQRYRAGVDDSTLSMALAASKLALARAGIAANQLDAVIVATSTPEEVFPSTACRLSAALGAGQAGSFDLTAACSGFVYSLHQAYAQIRSGLARQVLVVASEVYSRILNPADRTTSVLFGDGAGAVVLSAADSGGILASRLHAEGLAADVMGVPARLNRGQIEGSGYFFMEGQAVFKLAVKVLAEVVDEVLQEAGLARSDVDFLIPHQANIRIIQALARHLNLPLERVATTVTTHANTSAASIPLALESLWDHIPSGAVVVLAAVGGGLTWGAQVLRQQ